VFLFCTAPPGRAAPWVGVGYPARAYNRVRLCRAMDSDSACGIFPATIDGKTGVDGVGEGIVDRAG
jgi:hypothetical protein